MWLGKRGREFLSTIFSHRLQRPRRYESSPATGVGARDAQHGCRRHGAAASGAGSGGPCSAGPGGASGGILPASKADLPLDFGSLDDEGCIVGSAAIVVLAWAAAMMNVSRP